MKIDDHWVNDLDPYAIRFPNSWPIEGVRWYGIAYILGFLSVYLIFRLHRFRRRLMLSNDQIDSLITHLVIGAIIGGRLGYIFFYEIDMLISDPIEIFRIWHGGMSSHGGFAGVALSIYWFSKKNQLFVLPIADAVVSVAPLGIFFGRLANFINGELYGRCSNMPWAIIFPGAAINGYYSPPRHPSQIYEALTEGLLLLANMQICFWAKVQKKTNAGHLVAKFLIIYSLLRIFCEHFREPDAALMLGVTRGQFYSVFTLFCGCGLKYFLRQKRCK
ncbi:MAG: prolipoprotein diacylglyceryl transferase [Puniceicoccales bacterium]|jgi:phosphatidylglycerol:prolipoprotein diacylglycerol transferase|nr:prolipoprotein diacylglyceryl transferase [Puniceicoccales bacterium]